MYILHHLYVRNRDGWHMLDQPDGRILAELAAAYDRVCPFVSWPGRDIQAVELHMLWATIPSYLWTGTLGDYLATVTEPTLPEAEVTLLGEAPCMVYADLFSHPVNVTTGNRDYSPGSNIPIGDDIDVVVLGDNGIVDRLADSCLFSVNGRILPTMQVNDALYILNARIALKREDEAHQVFGTFDLSPLGEWSYHTMDSFDLKVISQTQAERMAGRVRVRVKTDFDLSGKHVLSIIDGHPQWLWDTLEVVDRNTVVLTLSTTRVAEYILRTPVHQRVTAAAMNVRDTGIDVTRLDLIHYLTHTPSALIIIDNDDVNQHAEVMGRTGIPGRFSFHYPPKGMLLLEDGTMAEYAIEGWDGDQASIGIVNGSSFDYIHRQVNPEETAGRTNVGRHPRAPSPLSGHMLNLYTTKPAA